ncbi:unnamed protein product [Brassica napus]|uniref:(rape) hypothetical protein n=1 Tax=Brassica napus TaxID=3708 RepID=A0A816RMN3_BRANA|nr:unnamed protein product [Brassica napus]
MSNGTDQAQPPSEKLSLPVESRPKKRASPGDNWAPPPGWTTEEKVRTSGTKAGLVDKFYYEPVTNRKFRSRTEVMYYLEHGTPKKKNKKSVNNSDTKSQRSEDRGSYKRLTQSNKKANEQPPPSPPPMPLDFDFLNVPEKVIWTGTNGLQEAWCPFIGDYKIQESVSQDWDRAFTLLTANANIDLYLLSIY